MTFKTEVHIRQQEMGDLFFNDKIIPANKQDENIMISVYRGLEAMLLFIGEISVTMTPTENKRHRSVVTSPRKYREHSFI